MGGCGSLIRVALLISSLVCFVYGNFNLSVLLFSSLELGDILFDPKKIAAYGNAYYPWVPFFLAAVFTIAGCSFTWFVDSSVRRGLRGGILLHGTNNLRFVGLMCSAVSLAVQNGVSAQLLSELWILVALYSLSFIFFLKSRISGAQVDTLYKVLGDASMLQGLKFLIDDDIGNLIIFVVLGLFSYVFIFKGIDDIKEMPGATISAVRTKLSNVWSEMEDSED